MRDGGRQRQKMGENDGEADKAAGGEEEGEGAIKTKWKKIN